MQNTAIRHTACSILYVVIPHTPHHMPLFHNKPNCVRTIYPPFAFLRDTFFPHTAYRMQNTAYHFMLLTAYCIMHTSFLLSSNCVIICGMEKKGKITVYLPQRLYIEIYERHLEHHFSHLVSLLVEEFLKATDVRISWAEMPSKAEQREYLERKLKEFFSRNGLSTGSSKPPVRERPKQTELPSEPSKSFVQETPKEVYAVSKPKPVKEEPSPPPEEDDDIDILKSLDNLW